MVSWFNETNRGVERDFGYRFRGQESNAILKFFPKLFLLVFDSIKCADMDGNLLPKLRKFFNEFLDFRKLISYSVRLIDFNLSDVANSLLLVDLYLCLVVQMLV